MKKLILITSTIATMFALTVPAMAGTYTIRGDRYLRKYTAPNATQVYNAETEAQRVANSLCDVAWKKSSVGDAISTTHSSTNLEWNVTNREYFDAALFCAKHYNNTHIAYANAACYCYELPAGTLPRMTALTASVWTDPYNAYGARISIYTSDSPTIPTDCATVRGDADGGIKLAGVAPRITRHNESENKDYWYPATSNVTFTATQLGANGIQLKRYLFVFVLLENYATSRGNWLEGSSYIDNSIKITTSADIPGWSYGCEICEPYATNYNLKNGHAGDDDDGDGLSNYTEYLITEVFHWGNLSISNKCSNGIYPDSYQKRGQLYFKEIFGAMNGAHVDTPKTPVNITAELSYYGNRIVTAPIYLRCWNKERDPDMVTYPDAVWKISSTQLNGTHTFTAQPDTDKWLGYDFSGKCKFEVWADMDGNGKYTPGEPFAFVNNVDTANAGASVSAILTDTSSIFARIDLRPESSEAVADCQVESSDVVSVFVPNEKQLKEINGVIGDTTSGNVYRIRVERVMSDDEITFGLDDDDHPAYVKRRTVLDKKMNLNCRSYIHEGDFLDGDMYDVDWEYLNWDFFSYKNVYGVPWATKDGGETYYPPDSKSISYSIIIDMDGDVAAVASTNYNNIYKYVVSKSYDSLAERYYDYNNIIPVKITSQSPSLVYSAKAALEWYVSADGKNPDNTYPVFVLDVHDDNNNLIYSSGYKNLEHFRYNGNYRYSLPPIELLDNGNLTNATWRVAIYNNKFMYNEFYWYDKDQDRNITITLTNLSHTAKLIYNANNQQPMNDHGYSSIDVAVRYAGPTASLARLAYTNGAIRVEASLSPDFTGDPIGGFYSKVGASVVSNLSNTNTFERIRGLPQEGTYYVRAFIDANGNGVKDDFETSCSYPDAIVLTPKLMTPPQVTLYLQDADTDEDRIPDLYEFASAGWTKSWDVAKTNLNPSIIGGDTILFAETVGTASISRGLLDAYLTTLQNNQSFMRTLLNLGNTTKSIEAIRVEAEGNQ